MKGILLLFLSFCTMLTPICGQEIAFHGLQGHDEPSWQEQILQLVDIEELGEAAYSELLDELSELTVWSDTTATSIRDERIRQQLVLSGNRCLSQRAGYQNPTAERRSNSKAYLGDPWHTSVRYRVHVGKHWQAGLSLDKDAGEAWRPAFPGFDSWHGFVRARNIQMGPALQVSDAVVGHYRLRLGCGLLINQGFSLGKQFLTQQLLSQRSNTLTPHASITEAGFMQGAAADIRLGRHLSVLPYFSARQIDGTLGDNHVLTALQTDGMHRTQSEDRHRNAAWQIITGTRVGYRGEWFDIGVNAAYTQLQYNYRRQPNYYNANYFSGHELLQFSADYSARALGALLKGELAIDDKGGLATLNALQYKLGSYWQGTLLHRYYSNHYRQLHASAISESSGMQGEQGATLQLEGQLARYWQLQGMIDWFGFSQPQYGIREARSQGLEGTLRLLYVRHQQSSMARNITLGYRIKQKGDYIRHTLDATGAYHLSASVQGKTQLRARIHSNRHEDPTFGYAASQAIGWQCQRWAACPFNIEGQACYFKTDGYDSRIYLTERAILYGFGLPMLYGEGLRYSATATWAIGKRCHLDAKWALTNYANRATISSGLQQIASNTQQDLWLQVRIKL